MGAKERREAIVKILSEDTKPIKGIDLAEKFSVTRQIIVKDIAILRATGINIMATPEGYIYNLESNRVKTIIAVNHEFDRTIEELEIIVKYGGVIEDVIIEHSLYGEIKVNLMIKNLNDIITFKHKIEKGESKPLSNLTNGIHLHTISADNEENITFIKKELKEKKILL